MGKLEVHDGDKGDRVALEIRGKDARVFSITKRGELVIDNIRYARMLCFSEGSDLSFLFEILVT